MERMKEIYGMRVVPKYDYKIRLPYGGFVGIVIYSSFDSFCDIHISKMSKTEDSYFVDSTTTIPFEETKEHSRTSGRSKFEFLYLKAREFGGVGHEIAICYELAGHLLLLDQAWENRKEAFDRKRE